MQAQVKPPMPETANQRTELPYLWHLAQRQAHTKRSLNARAFCFLPQRRNELVPATEVSPLKENCSRSQSHGHVRHRPVLRRTVSSWPGGSRGRAASSGAQSFLGRSQRAHLSAFSVSVKSYISPRGVSSAIPQLVFIHTRNFDSALDLTK